jgi:hypothetical protein
MKYLSKAGGGRITLLPKDYVFSQCVRIPGNVVLVGRNGGFVIDHKVAKQLSKMLGKNGGEENDCK